MSYSAKFPLRKSQTEEWAKTESQPKEQRDAGLKNRTTKVAERALQRRYHIPSYLNRSNWGILYRTEQYGIMNRTEQYGIMNRTQQYGIMNRTQQYGIMNRTEPKIQE